MLKFNRYRVSRSEVYPWLQRLGSVWIFVWYNKEYLI
ncbi:hypothetical protein J2Z48_003010 [Croceifilum oryzae]|uniref:Uncharacterized protein n=1 Tax=Croceifilum oryzae TaxID=1553429 RepID=A0AAJ1TMY2_9BACL|nr:hypothetical protein [Croceifilum oryzae]